MEATNKKTGSVTKFYVNDCGLIIQDGEQLQSLRNDFHPEVFKGRILITIARGYDNNQIKVDATEAVKQELHENYNVEFHFRGNFEFLK
jgi:hypothetical protein